MTVLSATNKIRDTLRRSPTIRAAVVAARHRGLRADDVFIASYPRSGNTWIRFLLGDLLTQEPVTFESIDRLIPPVGLQGAAPELIANGRLIKTHERFRPEYRKAIYLIRDVRDVLISWYRVHQHDPNDDSGIDDFVPYFMSTRASQYGAWIDHVEGWRHAREHNEQILVYRFEDLQADPRKALLEIAAFLDVPAERERVDLALSRNTPEAMRRREEAAVEYLRRAVGFRSRGVRRGKVGGWRELLNERHMEQLAPALALNAELGYS